MAKRNKVLKVSFRTRFRCVLLVTFLTVVFVLTRGQGESQADRNDALDPFAEQPRIKLKDGHIIFETAAGKNITFKSARGSINVNGEDLGHLVTLAKSSSSELQRISSSGLQALEASVSTMSGRLGTLETRIESSSQFDDIKNKMDIILGVGGTNPLTPRQVRRAIRKVARLEEQLQRLTTLLTANECSSNPCRNGATCLDTFNGYICRCPAAWEGPNCEMDVNECSRFAGTDLGCQNGASCNNVQGGYTCTCLANWFGIHCTEQHDDCFSASNEALCGHGTCMNQPRQIPGQAKYKCFCEQGWTTNSVSPACTVDIDECAARRFPCSASPRVSCYNVDGGFHCGPCPAGYSGDGFTCADVNECNTNNGGCSLSPFVQCTNSVGGKTCGPCPPGFAGNGVICTFTGVCHQNNGGCHSLATCMENSAISGSFRQCRCPAGYMGSGVGSSGCVALTGTTCASNPCVHGTCIPSTAPSAGSGGPAFSCSCFNGYTGLLCEQSVSLCTDLQCLNGGTCSDAPGGGFICTCPPEWQGPNCAQPAESCGGRHDATTGFIKYPLNGGEYPHGQSCAWLITTDPGMVLNITFTLMHLEQSSACSYDFVQLNDGADAAAHTIGRYCGTELPPPVVTSHDFVYIWFNSDQSYSGNGFELSWNTTVPTCGGLVTGRDYGAVNSPGYPGRYPHNRDCYWLVMVAPGKRIQFHFATVAIEQHANCSFDFLKIFDGQREMDPVLKNICNSTQPSPVTTSGNGALLHFHSDDSLNDAGFHVTFASIPGIPGCGGTLTRERGSLASPNFPEQYGHNVECDWIIRVHPEERIKLTFTSFDIERHTTCSWDYVEVHDGPNEASPLSGRYCGQALPPAILSSSNVIFVKFRADFSFSGAGFRAEYTTACGGTYEGSGGVIKSPYYPDPYPANRDCEYRLVGPISSVLRLEFQQFEVEGSDGCVYDYLEVKDGGTANGTRLGRLCGHVLPDPITSRYNEIWMTFKTDGSDQNRGFYANYSAIDITCGGVLTDNLGSFTSPNHPTEYMNSMQCHWIIRAPPGFVVRLTFAMFSLEGESPCLFDYVDLTDGSGEPLGKFCGSRTPPMINSRTNQLLVTFQSDESFSREGFGASYVFLNASVACGGHFFGETGVIRSPGWPSHYQSNRACVWTINAAEGHQVALNFTAFELEEHSKCEYDFLEIRNGGEITSPLVGRYCGANRPPRVVSHSNKLFLRFNSDSSMPYPGFEVYFDGTSTGCGGVLTSPTGSVESPNYPMAYGHNAECDWLIKVSRGSTVSLHITDIDIEPHDECMYDFIELFDGSTDRSPSIGRFCNGRSNMVTISSKSNVMFLKFRSDVASSGRGFRITYSSNCSTLLHGRRGVIESPNFPNSYPHNVNCSWTVEGPLGNNLTFAVSNLQLETGDQCQNDYLEILEESSALREAPPTVRSIRKFCGRPERLPPAFNISSNIGLVRFSSDVWESHSGFRLEWSAVGCGGDFVNKEFGVLKSPNYPNGYPLRTVCLWHIQAPLGSTVALTLYDFDLESSQDCFFDYLAIFNGMDDSTQPISKICHRQSQVQTITTSGNTMTVKMSSDGSVVKTGFRAEFYARTGGCSGIYTNVDKGLITSPHYPGSYDRSSDCSWTIDAKPHHTVELTLEDFEMPSSVNCTSDFLEVLDCSTYETLFKHCGRGLPTSPTVTSITGNLCLHMITSNVNPTKGFKASFRQACGGAVSVTSWSQTLTSANYPLAPSSTRGCEWILTADQPENKVILTFIRMVGFPSISGPSTGECDDIPGYLEIRDGDSGDSPLVGKYCGTRTPRPIVSAGSTLHVKLVGTYIFAAHHTSTLGACGGVLASASGYFLSPGYPSNYPIDTECVWYIVAPEGNRVAFNFLDFAIEQSDFCSSDFVELREGDRTGPLIGRYCGPEVPVVSRNVTSVSNALWIMFRSDSEGTAQGFEGHYSLVHGVELTGARGWIKSPGWPTGLLVNEPPYTWTIIVASDKLVQLSFIVLELMTTTQTGECYQSLAVYDGQGPGAPELGRYCGHVIPEMVTSSSNVMTLVFNPSEVFEGRFRLFYEEVSERVVTVPVDIVDNNTCVHQVSLSPTTGSLAISSPGYPFGYASHLNCTWIVAAPKGHHVSANVVDMNIEGRNDTNCRYDFVKLYYRTRRMWHLNRTLCGRYAGEQIEIMTRRAKIEFHTDSFVNGSGFQIGLSSGCGGEVSFRRPGVLSTDHVYGLTECTWSLLARPGRTIKLTFEDISIQSSGPTCSEAYLIMRNGASNDSPYLGQGHYCGTQIVTIPDSASNQVLVQFRAPLNSNARFRLRYEAVSIGCGGQLSLDDSNRQIEITSPNYPSIPPHDVECDWVITGPPHALLRIDFNLARPGSECNITHEFVEVRDGGTIASPALARYCIPVSGDSLTTSDHIMFVRFVTSGTVMYSSFKATVSMNDCGGTYTTGYRVAITGPKTDGTEYGNNMKCKYYVRAPHDQYYFSVRATAMDIPSTSADCSAGDNLEIRDDNENGRLIGQFCRNETFEVQSLSDTVFVYFQSDYSGSGRGFSLYFEPIYGCGQWGLQGSEPGYIISPNFPEPFPYEKRCSWSISIPEARKLKLEFESYNLKRNPRNASQCLDEISIGNEFSTVYTTLPCGEVPLAPMDLVGTVIHITLTTRGLGTNEGFKIRYSAEEAVDCGGILTEPSGVIQSADYGASSVGSNQSVECVWVHRFSHYENKTMGLVYDMFEVPVPRENNRCTQGAFYQGIDLETYNGGVMTSDCGNKTSQPIQRRIDFVGTPTWAHSVWFVLRMNYSDSYRGLSAKYSVQDCGGIFNAYGSEQEFNFTSPNYPSAYPSNALCRWIIYVNYGSLFELTFDDFELEQDCSKDYVQLAYGPYHSSPQSVPFCGTQNPGAITAMYSMQVTFRTDSSGAAKGFSATVRKKQQGCGGLAGFPGRHIHVPSDLGTRYQNNVECVYVIEQQIGFRINISFFGRFDVEQATGCASDYIQIEENIDDSWQRLGPRLCGIERPASILTNSHNVRLIFRSNEAVTADGFTFWYHLVCGDTYTDTSGVITSPNWPESYQAGVVCQYLISRPNDYITLEFDEFSLESPVGGDCVFDYVDIYLGNSTSDQKLGRFCGRDGLPPRVQARGAILITMRTDNSVQMKGFKANYRVAECGANLTEPSGEFRSPTSDSGKYHQGSNCTWNVAVAANKAIELKFTFFDLQGCYRCFYCDHVEVRDGSNASAPLIGRFCGLENDVAVPLIKTRGNKMFVRFHSDFWREGKGFVAAYRTTLGENQGCGGVIELDSGVLVSSDGDSNGKYDADLDCTWYIVASANKTLKLTFETFDLESSPANMSKCSYDYVEVRDGPHDKSPLIDRFCGTVPANQVVNGATNKLFVHFHSDSRYQRSGFRIRFSSEQVLCGGLIEAQNFSQTLTSPNYGSSSSYPPAARCRWHFIMTAPWMNKIALRFNDFNISCPNGDSFDFSLGRNSAIAASAPYQICDKAPPRITAPNNLWLTFQAGSTASSPIRKGFSLDYQIADCNETFVADSGFILSHNWPSYYTSSKYCLITIKALPGRTVSLYFHQFALPGSRTCDDSKMEIRDGLSPISPVLALVCGSSLPDPIFSTSNEVTIYVASVRQQAMYNILYSTPDEGRGCGGNITHYNGTFTSPMYPRAYNRSVVCRWFVNSIFAHAMTLHFDQFALTSDVGCDTNYIELYDGLQETPGNLVSRYCGNDVPASYQSHGSQIMLKMVTSTNNTGIGFKVSFASNEKELETGTSVATAARSAFITRDGNVHLDYGYGFGHN